MTQKGIVTASKLNLRIRPSGTVLKVLPKGTAVDILDFTSTKLSTSDKLNPAEAQGNWLKVRVEGQDGFVSAQYIQREPDERTPSRPEPQRDTSEPGTSSGTLSERSRFRFMGRDAIAPDGTRFARKFRRGVFNSGETSLGEFVSRNRERFTHIAPSLLRVMEAVSENEGKLEAINTWDSAFLSFGVFQWTAGVQGDAGELAALMERLKQTDESIFEAYFGRYGLNVSGIRTTPGVAPRGFFLLDGMLLNTAVQKEERLRTLDWAYRFWQAGHDDTVRQVQTEHAISRMGLFYREPKKRIGDRFVADYVTSEFGVALLLDQHVNRPGHVPGTLAKAVAVLVQELGADRPGAWGDAEEQRLLDVYLRLRSDTSMTDSDKRADTVRKAVAKGLASDKRGSFQMVSD